MDFAGGCEVDAVDFVDHVAQEVAVDHAVDGAFEDSGDYVAAVAAVGALQAAEVGEEAGPFLPSGPRASSLFTKAINSSPVMPSGLAAQSRQR